MPQFEAINSQAQQFEQSVWPGKVQRAVAPRCKQQQYQESRRFEQVRGAGHAQLAW